MRILFVTDSYLPTVSGVSIFVHQLALTFYKYGETVGIMAPGPNFLPEDYVAEGLHIFRTPSLPNVLRPDARISVPQRTYIRDVLTAFRPDIIHIQSPIGLGAIAASVSKKAGIPIVATHHFTPAFVEAYLHPPIRPLATHLINHRVRTLYNRLSLVTCPTQTVATMLRESGVTTPLRVISNGLAVERFSSGSPAQWSDAFSALPIDPTVPIVLTVGRIDPDKHIWHALAVAAEVVRKRQVQFVFAGSGSLLNQARQWVEDQGLADRIILIGNIPHNSHTLPELYAHSRIFFIASYIETQSIVTLEAMASGLPVIASRGGAIGELVKPGYTGMLVDPHKPEEAVEALCILLDDTDEANRLGGEGKKLVNEYHSLSVSTARFLEAYTSVI